ncbi:cysteine methyltransferase [Pokkaliibacter plantistimulans]|uniref:Methylated-DNA--protein-cysteine methyltransferase n=1 Tax=Proteobacteria bacterium 228 TaxID=2083153 RepID=A0A2S5KI71_9PROT|nr:methylated-DNA--[protein]-cysteine S-methyltransferase [Pokkaliibacter plantistimulans]PPC74514.1 cysteine methyltransferase [Pokkaliibacter plantistimulans]
MIQYLHIHTELGGYIACSEQEQLHGLYRLEQKYFPVAFAHWQEDINAPLLQETARQLRAYLDGQLHQFDLPLQQRGTPFQQRVWSALQHIGYGATLSYRELAERLGQPSAIRAVASANGRNPWSIVVPCHRVIGSDGSLTGYAGGVECKRWLLQLEANS